MLFKNGLQYNPKSCYCLTKYHPYRIMGEINPAFRDSGSGLILDLKEDKPQAIDYFYKKLNDFLPEEAFTICRVPSSDPEKMESGITTIARRLAAKHGRIDGTLCLVRVKKISKLAHGGLRGENVHLESILIVNKELIEGKNIILLDDVLTTGNSLKACKKILFEAGARKVQAVAIARTI